MATQKGTSLSTLRIVLFVFALSIAAIIFKVDIEVPLGITIGALYTIVIFFSWLLQGNYDTVIIAIICSVLLFVGFFNSPVGAGARTPAEINRVISIILIWTCSMLVILAKKGFEGAEKALEDLEVKVRDRTKALFQSREELKESERLYRYLYENAHEMYVSVDPKDASIIKCNETLCKKLGYTKEELIGQHIFFAYHRDCLEEVERVFKEFQKTGEVHGAELTLKTKKGKKIDVILNVSSAADEDGNILYSRSSWTDVTSYKQTQRVLKERARVIAATQRKFETLLENAPDAMVIVDRKGEIQLVNEQVRKIFGYKQD